MLMAPDPCDSGSTTGASSAGGNPRLSWDGHAMRRRYLVTYDIADEKRLKKVFKVMKDYGDHLQFSVFLCDLNEVEKIRMEGAIRNFMNEKSDQVLIVDLGIATRQVDEENFYALGRPLVFQPRAKIV